MKKLIIATVAVLTTVGVSAYTKDNSQAASFAGITKSQHSVNIPAFKTAEQRVINNEIDRANLALVQAD